MNHKKSRAVAIVLRPESYLQLFKSFSQLLRKFFKTEETIEHDRRTFILEALFDFNQLSIFQEIKYFSCNLWSGFL